MKKALLSVLVLAFCSTASLAQDEPQSESGIRPAAIGFGFVLNDFTTASRIRQGSLSSVLTGDRWAKSREMVPGLAITYSKGLLRYLDFFSSLSVSAGGEVIFADKPASSDGTLLQADAAVQLKMFPENTIVVPFASIGLGASIYKGYYGALMPIGAGFRIRFSDEFSLLWNSQYRVAITEAAGYHFSHGIGIQAKL